jgi:xyloglucan-specific exo-beta-1,4-glucanase
MKRIQQISLVLGLAVLAACNTQNPIATNPNEASSDPKAAGINKLVKASGPNAWDNIAQEGTAVAGGKYTASFRVKGAGEVSLRLFEGSWGKSLAYLPCTASSAWKTCSVAVTMGANPKFTFNISNSGPASTPTFVDDAKLLDSSGKNILVNSDFEAATIAPWWFGPAFTLVTEDTGTPPPPPPPSTGTTVWKNVEVGGGGMVTGVVVHPKERNLVYARTDVGGIFRWNETTGSWIPLSDGFTKAQAGYFGVESLAVDPSDPNIVFAAVGNGKTGSDTQSALLKSIDRGTSWRILKTDIDIYGNNNWRASGERLAVDPNSSAVVYFGSREQGLWRSTNGGSSWSAVTTLPKGDAVQGVGFVAFDPTSGTAGVGSKRVWVGIAKEGVFQSDDAGATWRRVLEARNVTGAEIPGYLMGDVSVSGKGILYASFLKSNPANNWVEDGNTPNGVYRLEAGVWTNISPDRAMNFDGMSAVTVAGQDHLLVTPWFTAYEWRKSFSSEDGGRTWARIDFNDGDVKAQEGWVTNQDQTFGQGAALDPFDPNRAWAAGGFGIWRTDSLRSRDASGNSSAKWTTYAKGISETVDITGKSLANGNYVSGISDLAGFVYSNLDVVPDFQAAHQTPLFTYTSIDALSSDPNYLVAVGQDQIYWYDPNRAFAGFSTNGGIDWQRFPTIPQDARVGRIALGLGDKNNIVWAQAGEGVYATLDGGRTWTKGLIEGTNESFSPMYYYNGPFVSTYLDGEPLAADKVNPKTFYVYGNIAGSQTKLYRSINGGLTWKAFAPFTDGMPWHGGEQLRSKPGKAAELLLARGEQGLWRSVNGGQDFTKITAVSRALGVAYGKSAPNRTNPTIFVAGVVNGVEGIWRSDDDAATWVRISTPANNVLTGKFFSIEGDINIYGQVYIMTGGRGTFYGKLQ